MKNSTPTNKKERIKCAARKINENNKNKDVLFFSGFNVENIGAQINVQVKESLYLFHKIIKKKMKVVFKLYVVRE